MIIKNEFPVCEYDTSRAPIIDPKSIFKKYLPQKCVITFFRKELEALAKENSLPIIGYMHSETADIPIYEFIKGSERLCITMSFVGAPGAACVIEELHAMGCESFVICGGAGALTSGTKVGEIVLPTAAVRDEGTSYHYIEPSREVMCNEELLNAAEAILKQEGVPFRKEKTWTTDAIYRETPDMIAQRRSEGCLTVEMETAAFFAAAQYHDIPLLQLLYTGDDVSSASWDSRNWDTQRSIRANLIELCITLIEKL